MAVVEDSAGERIDGLGGAIIAGAVLFAVLRRAAAARRRRDTVDDGTPTPTAPVETAPRTSRPQSSPPPPPRVVTPPPRQIVIERPEPPVSEVPPETGDPTAIQPVVPPRPLSSEEMIARAKRRIADFGSKD